MDLIKIENRQGKETVNARELHEFLESKQDFSTWIKNRIEKYKFVVNIDYVTAPQNYGTANGGYSIRNEYYLSIDMAKELSMVENNEKGRQARRYFIECENRLKKTTAVSSNLENMFIVFMQEQARTNNLILSLIQNNNTQKELPQYIMPEHYSLKAYMIKNKMKVPMKGQMITHGKELKRLSIEMNKQITKVPDEQYGEVNGYHIEVLDKYFGSF